MSSQLLGTCLNHLEDYGNDPAFRSHFDQVRSKLLSSADVAGDLTRLTAQTKDFQDPSCQLLGLLLDEARMGLENDNEHASGFLETVEMVVEACISTGAIDHANMAVFAGLYRSANLPVPPTFIIDPATMPPPQDFDFNDFDPAENLENIAQDVIADGGSAYDMFNSIQMMQAAMPEEIQAFMAQYVATMDSPVFDPVFERCAIFMLLSGSKLVQEATITGLSVRLNRSGLTPETQAFLPMIRGWFAAGPAQAGLDSLIRKSRSKSLPIARDKSALKIVEIAASITDGAGAQSICVIMKQNAKTILATSIIKAGYGINDAFLISTDASDELEAIIREMRSQTDAIAISSDTMRVLLEGAIAEGLKNDRLPAPGFLDIVETCGLFDLRPNTLDLSTLRDLADPDRKIQGASAQALGRWINADLIFEPIGAFIGSWFEDTTATRQIFATQKTARGLEAGLWAYLETRRDIWARRFLQTALVLRDAKRLREWKILTASAHGLIEGRALKRVPLMENIVSVTIEAEETKNWRTEL